jgi:hypothetical protein
MTDFGYSTIGSAGNDNPADNWIWIKATSTPAGSGTLTSISVYCAGLNTVTSSTIVCALYSDSSGAPGSLLGSESAAVAVSGSFGWVSTTFNQSIVGGTQYWFGIRCPNYSSTNNDVNVKFDTNGGATEGYYKNGGTAAFPSTVSGATSFSGERWSIYGTYTPSGGSASSSDSSTFGDTANNVKLSGPTDGATVSDGSAKMGVSAADGATYQTAFPLTENPISESGTWQSGQRDGADWTDVRTTPGKVFGQQTGSATGNAQYADSIAFLKGAYGPDQTVTGVVFNNDTGGDWNAEVELFGRARMGAHGATGIEFNYNVQGRYATLVYWNGPLGSFTNLAQVTSGLAALQTGDVLKLTIVGSTITGYLNGVAIPGITATAPGQASGNPGLGFYLRNISQTGDPTQYGFTSFSATDGTALATLAEQSAIKLLHQDVAAFAEQVAIAVSVSSSDTATAASTQTGASAISSSDSATAGNSESVNQGGTTPSSSDTGTLAEQIRIALADVDSAQLGQSMAIALAHQDTATLQDLVAVALAIADAANLSEQTSSTAAVNVSDSGSVTDSASRSSSGGPGDGTDSSGATESAGVGAAVSTAESSAPLGESAAVIIRGPGGTPITLLIVRKRAFTLIVRG